MEFELGEEDRDAYVLFGVEGIRKEKLVSEEYKAVKPSASRVSSSPIFNRQCSSPSSYSSSAC